MRRFFCSATTYVLAAVQVTAGGGPLPENGSLRLSVKTDLLRNRRGNLCVSLFNASDGFPAAGEKAVFSDCFKIEDLSSNNDIAIANLSTGIYALAMFHDENSDGILNTGILGIPAEGFGFSSNPKIRFSAPKFSECTFQLSDSNGALAIDLRYFL